jgi:hypothetical protein
MGGHFGNNDCRRLDCRGWFWLTLLEELVIHPARIAPNKRFGFFRNLTSDLIMGNELDRGFRLGIPFLEVFVVEPTREAPFKGFGLFPSLRLDLFTGNEWSATLRNNVDVSGLQRNNCVVRASF